MDSHACIPDVFIAGLRRCSKKTPRVRTLCVMSVLLMIAGCAGSQSRPTATREWMRENCTDTHTMKCDLSYQEAYRRVLAGLKKEHEMIWFSHLNQSVENELYTDIEIGEISLASCRRMTVDNFFLADMRKVDGGTRVKLYFAGDLSGADNAEARATMVESVERWLETPTGIVETP